MSPYNVDHQKFGEYIENFGKSYATLEEFKFRQELFIAKDKLIEEWNNKDGQYHILGHNQFSDWTEMELKKLVGSKPSKKEYGVVHLDATNLADSVDWRTKGAVTPVQNQRVC